MTQVVYEYVVVHHSASPLSTTMEELKQWHLEKGWTDIGYHFVIEKDDLVKKGRDIRSKGSHSYGAGNNFGIGICAVGDNTIPKHAWTEEQKKSLKELYAKLKYIGSWYSRITPWSWSARNSPRMAPAGAGTGDDLTALQLML